MMTVFYEKKRSGKDIIFVRSGQELIKCFVCGKTLKMNSVKHIKHLSAHIHKFLEKYSVLKKKYLDACARASALSDFKRRVFRREYRKKHRSELLIKGRIWYHNVYRKAYKQREEALRKMPVDVLLSKVGYKVEAKDVPKDIRR